MLRLSNVLALAILSSLLVAGGSAQAQNGSGLGLSYLFGYGSSNAGGFGGFQTSNNFTPPYFALHPPVYYGQRYTTPYGLSPFAAWPQLQPTPGFHGKPHVDRAQMIANPYCIPCANATPASTNEVVSHKRIEPLVIDNPFFKSDAVQLTSKTLEVN